jgi:hypothetical protein
MTEMASMSGNAYSYESLPDGCIRLLEVLPGTGKVNESLSGKISTYFLPQVDEDVAINLTSPDQRKHQQPPPYVALSYSWGNDAALAEITIHNYEEAKDGTIKIRPNLEEALKTFRRSIFDDHARRKKAKGKYKGGNAKTIPEVMREPRHFWIDAICINQAEEDEAKEEKGKQLERMTEIYNTAEEVRVWLGEGNSQNQKGMKFVEELNDFDRIDELCRTDYDDRWDAFHQLMRSEWFQRRWIIQEIALARKANVYCGSSQVSWFKFTYAVSVFVEKAQDLKRLFTRSEEFKFNPDYLGELSVLPAKVLCETIPQLLLKTEDGEVLEYLLTLETLIAKLTYFESSVSHDTVYAILSLAHDAVARSMPSARAHDKVAQTPLPSPILPKSEEPLWGYEKPPHHVLTEEPQAYNEIPPESNKGGDDGNAHELLDPVHHQDGPAGQKSQHLLVPARDQVSTRSGRPRSGTGTRQHMLKAEGKEVRQKPNPLKVNYKQSVYETCRDVLQFVIGSSKSLDIICLPWAPPKGDESDLPSWITPAKNRPFELVSAGRIYNRASADPLVYARGTARRVYNASGKTRAFDHRKVSIEDLISDRVLKTKGRLLGKIQYMAEPAMDATIPQRWFEMANWNNFDEDPPTHFLRTIVADRDSTGQGFVPPYFAKACQWATSERPGFPLSTKDLLNQERCPELAIPFLRRVQAVTCNRRLVLTENAQLLALVPAKTQEGDSICIIHGCSVPVVLRLKQMDDASKPIFKPRTRAGTKNSQKRKATEQPDQYPSTRSKKGKAASKDLSIDVGASLSSGAPSIQIDIGETDAGSHATDPGTADSARSVHFPSTAIPDEGDVDVTPRSTPGLPHTQRKDMYVLVGECYVDGMMEGEGFKYADDAGNLEEEFLLV